MGSKKFRIKRDDSVLVAIDYQEKLMPVMSEIDRLRDKISRLTVPKGTWSDRKL